MLMSPIKGETAVHGYQCLSDMAVRMREVPARLWVSLCMPLVLSLPSYNVSINLRTHANFWLLLCLCQKVETESLETKRQQEICLRSHVM